MASDEMRSARAAPSHEGEAVAGAGEVGFAAEESGVRLTVVIAADSTRHVIVRARHAGTRSPADLMVLDRLCALIEGRPIQEAADHGVIYAIEEPASGAAPVVGIRTPRNAGPAFALAEKLIRAVHAAAQAHFDVKPRESRWYVRPKAVWLALTEAQQIEALRPTVNEFLAEQGVPASDMWITRVERGTRVTLDFAESVYYARKPKLLMDLERRLRRATGDPLEVFMEDKKDANKIRRL
jgi:hypothetical protein